MKKNYRVSVYCDNVLVHEIFVREKDKDSAILRAKKIFISRHPKGSMKYCSFIATEIEGGYGLKSKVWILDESYRGVEK